MRKRRILLVEDVDDLREQLAQDLRQEGYEVHGASNGREAVQQFKRGLFPVVLTDIIMPGGSGLAALAAIKKLHPPTNVIILTGMGGPQDAIEAVNLDAFAYIEKADQDADLHQTIEAAFARYDEEMGPLPAELSLQALEVLSTRPPSRRRGADEGAHVQQLRELAPGTPAALVDLGLLEYRRENYARAAEHLEKALQDQGPQPEVLYYLGNAYLQQGLTTEAMAALERALALDSDCAHAHYSIGVIHGRNGRYDSAIKSFERALQLRPDDGAALHSIGVAYGKLALYEQAIASLEQSLSSRPAHARSFFARLSMGLLYREAGDYPKAIEQLRHALQVRQDDPFALMVLGMAYKEAGDLNSYAEHFIKAFAVDPAYAFGFFRIESEKAERLRAAELELATKRHMLAFLTHTIRGTFCGAPETIDQTLRQSKHLLASYQDRTVAAAMNNLASLHAAFSSISNMLDAYKLMVGEPEELRRRWSEDHGGDRTPAQLVAALLKSVLAQLLFQYSHLEACHRLVDLADSATEDEILQSFLQEVLTTSGKEAPGDKVAPGDIEVPGEAEQVSQWIEAYFPVIDIDISAEVSDLQLSSSGVRYSVLFACISEIILNALKYTDGRSKVRFSWQVTDHQYVIRCENSFDQESTRRAGSREGLGFIGMLLGLLEGVSISHRANGNTFTAELSLSAAVFAEGSDR